MLKFIKNIFKIEEKKEVRISLVGLKDFIEKEKIKVISGIEIQLNEIRNKIKEGIYNAKTNIENLENAKLRNPNIPMKEFHFMEGNRESYIKKARLFIESINFNVEISNLKDYIIDFENNINNFGKTTYRPYSILQHFFSEETGIISKNIKQIEDLIHSIKKILDENNYDLIIDIDDEIDDLFRKIELKKSLEADITATDDRLKALNKQKEELESEIDGLRESEEYKELINLKAEKEVIKEKLSNHDSIIIHPFSIIEQSLKKYSRITFNDEKLISDYIIDPVQGLKSDDELRILSILDDIKSNINKNLILMKDKKKDRTLESINGLDRAFFRNFTELRTKIEDDLARIVRLLENNMINEKISDKEKEINNCNEDIQNAKRLLHETNEKINKIDIGKLIKNIEGKIDKMLSIKLKIG